MTDTMLDDGCTNDEPEKIDCPTCDGWGVMYDEERDEEVDCSECDGMGEVDA